VARTVVIWAMWLGVSGLLAGCSARATSPAASATAPRSSEPAAGATSPEMPRDPHAAIEQLDGEITTWRTQIGLEAPPPDAIAAAAGRPLPMAAEGCQPVTGTPSPAGAVCGDVCRLADSICGNAERICGLADQLAGTADADWAADRCAGAKASCAAARDRCCGCK
jgi:hypothetical protein